MKIVRFYLGLLPTSSEVTKEHSQALVDHAGTALASTNFTVMSATAHEQCDSTSIAMLEAIHQEPEAFDTPQLAAHDETQAAMGQAMPGLTVPEFIETTPLTSEGLHDGFFKTLREVAIKITARSKWKVISPIQILGCTNLVIPALLNVKLQRGVSLDPKPGTIVVFELLRPNKTLVELANTTVMEP